MKTITYRNVGLVLTLASLLQSACAEDGAGTGGDGLGAEDIGSTALAITSGNLDWVSEEPGMSSDQCQPNSYANTAVNIGTTVAKCRGQYCDDMQLTCAPLPNGIRVNNTTSGQYWTSYISEERPSYKVSCNRTGTPGSTAITGIVDGIQAAGKYGDRVSLHCRDFAVEPSSVNCEWSLIGISEESGPLQTPWGTITRYNTVSDAGRFIGGVQCDGQYCDTMKYLFCSFVP